MKIFLCLLLLVCFDNSQAGKQVATTREWISQMHQKVVQDHGQHQHRPQHNQHQQDSVIVGLDMNNPQVNIESPCQKSDINCIGQFLSKNSGCTPVQGPPPSVYKIKTMNGNIPIANATVTILDADLVGLTNSIVNEFYVNRDTNTMVMEVVFPSLSFVGLNTAVYFFRKGMEPLMFNDYSITDYSNLSLTWIVRLDHGIDLDNGHVFAYLNTPATVFISPKLEPVIDNQQISWQEEINLKLREVLVQLGRVFFKAFVESTICDFRYQHK